MVAPLLPAIILDNAAQPSTVTNKASPSPSLFYNYVPLVMGILNSNLSYIICKYYYVCVCNFTSI